MIDRIDIPKLDKHWMVVRTKHFLDDLGPAFLKEQERQYPSCTAVELQT